VLPAAGRQATSAAYSSVPGGYGDDSSAPLIDEVSLGDSIDASSLVDTDGTAYLVWKADLPMAPGSWRATASSVVTDEQTGLHSWASSPRTSTRGCWTGWRYTAWFDHWLGRDTTLGILYPCHALVDNEGSVNSIQLS
jgi:hypothetical protein